MRTYSRLASRTYFAVALSLISMNGAAYAQSSEAENDEAFDLINEGPAGKDVFVFDFGVPSSPALTLLGIDKDKITQSNSLKPFVLSLPGILASDGEGRAVAFDGSIGSLLIAPSQQRYSRYQQRALLFRTRFNIGLYEGVDDDDASKDKPSRVTLGLSSSLLNSSDPLLAAVPGGTGSAYIACLDAARGNLNLPVPTFNEAADAAAIAAFKKSKDLTAFATTCRDVADLAARLGTDFDVGGGLLLEGDPGKIAGLNDEAGVFWASFRTSFGASGPNTEGGTTFDEFKTWEDDFGRWFMIGASGRVGHHESVATGDTVTPQVQANTYAVWAGLESYSKSNRFALQVGQERIDPTGTGNSAFGGTRTVYNASYDQSLGDTGLWLSLSYGKAEGTGALKSDSTARVTLTFNAPTARRIFGGP